jgi:hypothetical protein
MTRHLSRASKYYLVTTKRRRWNDIRTYSLVSLVFVGDEVPITPKLAVRVQEVHTPVQRLRARFFAKTPRLATSIR